MSRSKTLIKQSKKKKKEQVIDTADDFLAAGVEHEEAAGKWRAGDALKSLRFFSRAVEVYDHGLQRFPQSLDLAYNKARVQLEVATHPLLVVKLDVPVEAALEAALESHRCALSLEPSNPDTLFNTAQVLTTIAEVVANKDGSDSQSVLKMLEEALELQSRCLTVQEMKYEENESQHRALRARADGADEDHAATEGSETIATEDTAAAEDQWFAVVEPVTKDTLVDTLLAQLTTLMTTCNVLAALGQPTSPSLSWIEEFSQSIITQRLPSLASEAEPSRQSEIQLAIAKFISALLEAGFRQGGINVTTYKQERDKAFPMPGTTSERSYDALLANAESLIAFESAVSDILPQPESAPARWHALSTAISDLAAASRSKDGTSDETAKTHYLRGDCSLLQHQLAAQPLSYPQAVINALQLLRNAEVFYRNASKLYQDDDQTAAAALRSELARLMQDNEAAELATFTKHQKGQDWVRAQLQEMLEEGLLPPDFNL